MTILKVRIQNAQEVIDNCLKYHGHNNGTKVSAKEAYLFLEEIKNQPKVENQDELHILAEPLVKLNLTNGFGAQRFLEGANIIISLQDLLLVVREAPGVL